VLLGLLSEKSRIISDLRDKKQTLLHVIAEKNKELIRCYNVEAKLTSQIIELRLKLQEKNK
jgi:ethanolamine utilization microcompartment shell protein EutS